MGIVDKESLVELGNFGWENIMALSLIGASIIIMTFWLLEKYHNNFQNILDFMVKCYMSHSLDKIVACVLLFVIFYVLYYVVSSYVLDYAIRHVKLKL